MLIIERFIAPRFVPWKLSTRSRTHIALEITLRQLKVTLVFSSSRTDMFAKFHLASSVTPIFVIRFKLRTSFRTNLHFPLESSYIASSLMHVFARLSIVTNFQSASTIILIALIDILLPCRTRTLTKGAFMLISFNNYIYFSSLIFLYFILMKLVLMLTLYPIFYPIPDAMSSLPIGSSTTMHLYFPSNFINLPRISAIIFCYKMRYIESCTI